MKKLPVSSTSIRVKPNQTPITEDDFLESLTEIKRILLIYIKTFLWRVNNFNEYLNGGSTEEEEEKEVVKDTTSYNSKELWMLDDLFNK